MFIKIRTSLIGRSIVILALLGEVLGIRMVYAAPETKLTGFEPVAAAEADSNLTQVQVETATMVKDIDPGSGSSGSSGYGYQYMNGSLYFSAWGGSSADSGLWTSDGTADGTVLVRGGFVTRIQNLENANGILYFAANDGSTGSELWKSDGTAEGTVLVKDINPGSAGSYPSSITNVNGTVYFKATDSSRGVELWKSDGTFDGTVLVKEIVPGIGSPNIDNLMDLNGILLFIADDQVHGAELWKSDGTLDGTIMIKDIAPGFPGTSYYDLTVMNGFVYFSANNNANGYELWKTNGTALGTVLVKDIRPGNDSSYPDSLENANGTLYFTADNGIHGSELWKSNGTSVSTVMVKDIWPGSSGWGSEFTHVDNTVYFGANDGSAYSLWKSDGTSAGTVKVALPGPGDIGSANGTVYYSGYDVVNGHELWRSDGTASGTTIVKDINPTGDSWPDLFFNASGSLYFRANDGIHGSELWRIVPNDVPTSTIRYVKWNASGANDGSSWTDAYTDLQSALAAASSGDEIWVAAGTYKPTSGTDRTISFVLKNGVAVYGGFAGTETSRDQRNPSTHLTILSGDLNGDDNGNIDPSAPTRAENVFHVVSSSGVGSATVLDGFTISGGNANGPGNPFDPKIKGGGMWNVYGDPTLANLIFRDNTGTHGGGMYSSGDPNAPSVPSITNVIFRNNLASSGGGLHNSAGSNPLLTNVTFSDNSAAWGGGMYNEESSPTLTNVTFGGNSAPSGGGIYNNYGGSPSLINVTFNNNVAESGGGIYNEADSRPELTNVTLTNNSAASGSGMFNSSSSPSLSNVTFSGNTGSAGSRGGAMVNDLGSSPSLSNVTFANNSVTFAGGAMLNAYSSNPSLVNVTFAGNSSSHKGGAIYNWESNPSLKHVTFSSNSSDVGGAIYNDQNSSPGIANSILYGDTGGEIYNNSGMALVTYSIIQGGYTGTGNLDQDPLLGPLQDNGGFTQTMALGAGSPAIDAADDTNCPATDQRGVARPQGSHCDIGAYEDQTIVRYVKQDATGTGDGSSWQNAHTDLQAALTAASPDEEIWVAAGTYRPTSGTDRTISFVLKNGVAVYGGFAGNETARDQRNYQTNLTVLSGDIGAEGNNSDNSYHVLVGSNTDNSAILDGFTITAGNANDVSSPYRSGGGMYIEKGAPRLNGLIFAENHAGFGGGLYTSHTGVDNPVADLVLTHVVFSDNTATWEGGGMALGAGNPPSVTFHLSLTDVLFENNTAVRTGGGLINNGGELELVDVTFLGNTATGGGGLSHIPYGPSTLTNVTFSNNYASEGGGGMLVGSSGSTLTTLTNVTFNNNSTALRGGGIANAGDSNLDLTNVTFNGNTAGENGGGLSNGVLGIETSGTVNLIYTTFSNNTATSQDSAIYNQGGSLNINNSILYGDTGHEIVNNAGTAAVTHSTVQGGYTGTGNIDQDPLLGPLQDNGGFTQAMALGAGSPAIDAADDTNCPATDQRGVTRPQGSQCDMGAYEYNGLDSGVDVIIGTSEVNSYVLSPHESQRQSYAGVNSGPVKIINKHGVSIMAAERVIYNVNGVNTSFSEIMGLPGNQLDTTYWLPWYNNLDLDTQLRFANVSNTTATVRVYIGGLEMVGSPFMLQTGESTRKSFPGVNSGPVRIVSNASIVAAERIIYKVNGLNTSFSEMMALPGGQVDTNYFLPWYNSVDLDTQLRFANVSNTTVAVRVYIGGLEMTGSPFILQPGESTRKSFAGVNNGPVEIVSTQPIVAAERVIFKVNGVNTSFSEMMALPNSQLDTTYWLPWYNNRDLDTQLRFANTTNTPATVHVFIGELEMTGSPFTLQPNESTRRSFLDINGGLVKIVSNVPIVAAERVIYKVNGVNVSFSEMMALPNSLLDATFWFPWYNNVDLDTQLRFGVP